MKPWPIFLALLAGCAGHADTLSNVGLTDLTQAAAEMEVNCDLQPESLLHPTPNGDLEVRSTTVSYPKFSCVMLAISKAKLADRGVNLIFVGEDSVQ